MTTQVYKPELSDFTMINFAKLRAECLKRCQTAEGADYFTAEECQGIEAAVTQAMKVATARRRIHKDDVGTDPSLAIVVRDLDPDYEASDEVLIWPKWPLLASWCAPESVAKGAPEFVAYVVIAALAGTLGDVVDGCRYQG